MPINVLNKNSPRGKGPDPCHGQPRPDDQPYQPDHKNKEEDLAAKEIQDLWEAQETGLTRWSGEGDTRFSDPD